MDVSETDTALAQGFLPLTPAVFHIMLALAGEERHGYGIMQEVERLTNGQVRLGPGTLYRSLQRMLVDGLIVELEGDQDEQDERRRTYRLTPLGSGAARLEAERLATLVQAARTRKLLPPIEQTTHPKQPGNIMRVTEGKDGHRTKETRGK